MILSKIECIYKTNITSLVNSIGGLKTPVDEAAMPVILNQNWSKNSNLPVASSLSYSHIKAQIRHRNTALDITIREERC